MLVGVVACLAMLPLAMIPVQARDATLRTARSGMIRLPDGSVAKLAMGATIRYRTDFAARRVLWLFGQATFEIVPGSSFAVWTETGVTKTTGSSIFVRAMTRESSFVAVSAGVARLRALNEDNDPAYPSVTIGPGQRAFAARTLTAHVIPP